MIRFGKEIFEMKKRNDVTLSETKKRILEKSPKGAAVSEMMDEIRLFSTQDNTP